MLIVLVGPSGSGKSTAALDMVKRSQGQLKRVNKDDLRAMVDAGQWSPQNEKVIVTLESNIIKSLLRQGFDVIADNTNFAKSHHVRYERLAQEMGHELRTMVFNSVDMEECIRRDALRDKPVGRAVIEKQWQQYAKDWNLP